MEANQPIQPPGQPAPYQNRTEYRPLDGFIAAYSPFNFTAIGGNLACAPALLGNVVLWKPSPMAILSNKMVHNILLEAGLPENVIQFLPADAQEMTQQALNHPELGGLHFTGSTHIFKMLWKQIANNLDVYRSYPRIVGEAGGKNFHLVHQSANVKNSVLQTIRSAFEYNGQKCSACSRAYVSESVWPEFKQELMKQLSTIKQGPVEQPDSFMTAVINQDSYDRIMNTINNVKIGNIENTHILFGGNGSDAKGYFVEPTVIVTTDPRSLTMTKEIFGPVLTVFVYRDDNIENVLSLIDNTTPYALTGAIFAQDKAFISHAQKVLRYAAGNIYLNDKSTGAIVGQQPFGGSRASGTNDKAGSEL
jgi:1-pyrroline-5-carboxylate dehydrogenase